MIPFLYINIKDLRLPVHISIATGSIVDAHIGVGGLRMEYLALGTSVRSAIEGNLFTSTLSM
jgi:hypothetical protein